MSLVEEFAANAELAGFVVHRGVAPEIEGAGVSTAIHGLAETGSVVLAAAPDEPRGRSLLPDVHITLLSEDRILQGLEELFAAVGDCAAERARDRHRPEPERGHRADARGRRPRPGRGARRLAPDLLVSALASLGRVPGTVPRVSQTATLSSRGQLQIQSLESWQMPAATGF